MISALALKHGSEYGIPPEALQSFWSALLLSLKAKLAQQWDVLVPSIKSSIGEGEERSYILHSHFNIIVIVIVIVIIIINSISIFITFIIMIMIIIIIIIVVSSYPLCLFSLALLSPLSMEGNDQRASRANGPIALHY